MNNIPQRQNEVRQIKMLIAQRLVYAKAKSLLNWRLIAAAGIGVAGPVAGLLWPDAKLWVGAIAFFYLIVEVFFLDSLESELRGLAARIQELFDTTVLDLPWNELVTSKRPDQEEIELYASGPEADAQKGQVQNWYAVEAGTLDLDVARVLCQRSNLWWDCDLRKKYRQFLLAALLGVLIFAFVISLARNVTLQSFLLTAIVPLTPLVRLLYQQIRAQHVTIDTLERLKASSDKLVEKAADGEAGLKDSSRVLQDELFRHRKACAFVPDWIYNRYKDVQEKQMQFSLKAKADEFAERRA